MFRVSRSPIKIKARDILQLMEAYLYHNQNTVTGMACENACLI